MTQTIESLQTRVAELEAENANLLAANRDCIEHFGAMQQDLAAAQLQIETLRDQERRVLSGWFYMCIGALFVFVTAVPSQEESKCLPTG